MSSRRNSISRVNGAMAADGAVWANCCAALNVVVASDHAAALSPSVSEAEKGRCENQTTADKRRRASTGIGSQRQTGFLLSLPFAVADARATDRMICSCKSSGEVSRGLADFNCSSRECIESANGCESLEDAVSERVPRSSRAADILHCFSHDFIIVLRKAILV